jgi:hypothetical protein
MPADCDADHISVGDRTYGHEFGRADHCYGGADGGCHDGADGGADDR